MKQHGPCEQAVRGQEALESAVEKPVQAFWSYAMSSLCSGKEMLHGFAGAQ